MVRPEVLAFDWGTSVIGILNVHTNRYSAYRQQAPMIAAANKIVSSLGTIVSFNGNGRDLLELSKLLDLRSVAELHIRGKHDDMLEITSSIRWPPDPGTNPIQGSNLRATYSHFLGDKLPQRPKYLLDKYTGDELEYIASNWLDCFMTAALWKKWKRGALKA